MLKIKDNVDLEELEKFGFVAESRQNGFIYEDRYSFYNNINRVSIYVCIDLRIVEPTISFDVEDLDIIFNLIKGNMVEMIF